MARRPLPLAHASPADAAVVRPADVVREQRAAARQGSLAAARVARNFAASARADRKALDRGAAVRPERSESVAERVGPDAAGQRGARRPPALLRPALRQAAVQPVARLQVLQLRIRPRPAAERSVPLHGSAAQRRQPAAEPGLVVVLVVVLVAGLVVVLVAVLGRRPVA